MPKLLKKFKLSFLLASLLLIALGVTKTVQAQDTGPWYNPGLGQFVNTVFDEGNNEIFGERYTYAQVVWITHSLTTLAIEREAKCIAGFSTGEVKDIGQCVEENVQKGLGGSAVGDLASLGDNILRAKPASGIVYVANVAGNLHLIPQAQAQEGFGFQTLEPIQNIWKVTRNMTYLLSIFALIAMAFMIMFRVRLSPQTVITIQSAIPRITIALLLITFSYAIAGFIIDLAYIATGLMAILVKSASPSISNLSLIDLFKVLNGSGQPLGAIFLGIMLIAILATVVGGVIGVGIGAGGIFVGMMVLLVFTIFVLFFLLRLLWLMFKTLVSIILLVIGGPIIILLGIFPGTGGFARWIRNLIAQVAVFIVVITLLFLAHYFFWQFTLGPLSTVDRIGPAIQSSSFQDLFNPYRIDYGTTGNAGLIDLPGSLGVEKSSPLLGIVISFVLLGIIPSAGNLVSSLLQGRPFDVKGALLEGLGPSRASGLYGTAKVFNIMEQKAIGAGRPTPPLVQTGRRLLGLKSS